MIARTQGAIVSEFRHDPVGRLLSQMRFEWNPRHQLVRSVVARGSSDTAQTVGYAYGPFGRRIAKRDAFGVTRGS
ncbi:hypothetical protein ACCD08_17870 [Telluria sp. Tellsp104]|jgi:YD repeat-containing protein